MNLPIKITAIIFALISMSLQAQAAISGAGSSLAYPVMIELTKLYKTQAEG
jgi:hypothetical protein